jgi:hypothetical protein
MRALTHPDPEQVEAVVEVERNQCIQRRHNGLKRGGVYCSQFRR